MALIMLASGGNAGFTWGGSASVVLFGTFTGAAAGFVLGLLADRVPGTRIAGGLFGLALFALMYLVPFESKQIAAGFPTLNWLTYPGFALLCILFGSTLNSVRGKQPLPTTKGESL